MFIEVINQSGRIGSVVEQQTININEVEEFGRANSGGVYFIFKSGRRMECNYISYDSFRAQLNEYATNI